MANSIDPKIDVLFKTGAGRKALTNLLELDALGEIISHVMNIDDEGMRRDVSGHQARVERGLRESRGRWLRSGAVGAVTGFGSFMSLIGAAAAMDDSKVFEPYTGPIELLSSFALGVVAVSTIVPGDEAGRAARLAKRFLKLSDATRASIADTEMVGELEGDKFRQLLETVHDNRTPIQNQLNVANLQKQVITPNVVAL